MENLKLKRNYVLIVSEDYNLAMFWQNKFLKYIPDTLS